MTALYDFVIDDNIKHQNNGLITKIWGGSGWVFNHSVTFGYPMAPTLEQKTAYKNYFQYLGQVLPCKFCRESYQSIISGMDKSTSLTADVLKDRASLTKWFYDVHQAVNAKLKVDYGVSYEDVVNRYESFRARCDRTVSTHTGCTAPLDYKAQSFIKSHQVDCPIIPTSLIKPFIQLAKYRNLPDIYFTFIEFVSDMQILLQHRCTVEFIKQQPAWTERNRYCHQLIQLMREKSILSVEVDGPWQGTPTICELILILFLCSNLNRDELQNIIDQKLNLLL